MNKLDPETKKLRNTLIGIIIVCSVIIIGIVLMYVLKDIPFISTALMLILSYKLFIITIGIVLITSLITALIIESKYNKKNDTNNKDGKK